MKDAIYVQNPKFGTSDIMQNALDWWNNLPIQDIRDCRNGWANLVMIYYPDKYDCQDVTIEEILYMFLRENNV